MTEEEANEFLRNSDNERKIFEETYYGKAVYAAVILNPKKAFDYIIELGIETNDNLIVKLLNGNETKTLENYGLSALLIQKLLSNRKPVSKPKGIKAVYSFGLSKEESEFLEFKPQILSRLSKENLINLGFSDIEVEMIANDELKPVESGAIQKLSDIKKPFTEMVEYIEGGISISNEYHYNSAGTLGGVFKMKNDENIYGITNSHVIIHDDGKRFPNIVQPGKGDSVIFNNKIGEVYWECDNEYMDAGIIKLSNPVKIGNFLVAPEISISYPIAASIGMRVKKFGRTTLCTEGKIRSINSTLYYQDPNTKKKIYYRYQIMTTSMAIEGDSGSLLLSENSHPMGLLFAKTLTNSVNFANHFNLIFDDRLNSSEQFPIIRNFEKFINFKTIKE